MAEVKIDIGLPFRFRLARNRWAVSVSVNRKMTEMHLDLCIQSTAHLLETVASIKENIRMLEVFLNSGLQIVDFSGSIGLKMPTDFQTGDYSKENSGSGYSSLDGQFYKYLSSRNGSNLRHLNCCCMCDARRTPGLRSTTGHSGSISRASVTTASNSSSSKKKAHIAPRLNKTASLRRAKVLQRIASSSTRI